VTYADGDRTLIITVLTGFSGGEHIVVTGPAFREFKAPPASGNLVLDVGGQNDSDDKILSIDAISDVRFFTATATNARVKLHWRTPPSLACASVRIMAGDFGDYPTGPGDGRLVDDRPCTPDTNDWVVDPSLLDDHLYAYAAFVDYGSGFTPGKFVKARTLDPTVPAVKWAYSTGATSMAPPGLRFQAGESYVYAVSNDKIFHSMRGGSTGGDWPPDWTPYLLGGPAQARPPVVPFAVGGAMEGAAFLGSQDGSVYAIDARYGSEEWKTPIASMVQAAPAGLFLGVDPFDIVFVGTRNGTAPNQLEALDKDTGAPVWSFTNSLAQIGDGKEIGIISGSASVIYATKRIYFASRARTGAMGSDKTLWCVDITSGSPQRCWARALGNIDGSPVVRGTVVYVGTNASILYALDAETGAVKWSYSLADGTVKGFVFPRFGGSDLFLATNRKVWSIADNGFSATVNWQVTDADIPSPSTPLHVPGTTRVLVGSSDGYLYQLDVLAPLPATRVKLGDGASAVGVPAVDILKSMIYVGTEAGIVYGVVFPLF
jgi:outer membrane protein assembly factor BamB